MNWQRNVPSWLTLGVLAAIVVGALALVGWIKPYLAGPDLALTTLYRPKPVPVKVETVKWLKSKPTVIKGPIQIIHDPAPKEAARLDKDFGIKLDLLHADNKELAKILDVPKAPHGGEMALTVSTATGVIDGVFRPKTAPFVQFGGIREIGVDFNVIQRGVTGYYRQDLGQIGPVTANGKVFATIPTSPGGVPTYGAQIGVAIRF